MSGPFAGTRVLLVDVENDPTGHAGLRKRALERLGCVVATCDLKEKKGLLSRWRGGSAQDRLGKAVLQHQAQLVLVVEGAELTAGMVTSLKRDSRCRLGRLVHRRDPLAPAHGSTERGVRRPVRARNRPGRAASRCLPSAHDPSPARL